jgi:hypothetical protein
MPVSSETPEREEVKRTGDSEERADQAGDDQRGFAQRPLDSPSELRKPLR